MRLIFMGTPEFAVPSLERLIHEQHQVVAVYTQPDRVAGRGRSLVLSPVKKVALARGLGMDVIVTDHHEPGEEVPAGAWVINPKLPGCAYPFRELSGAGLAFKLAWAIGKRMSPGKRVSEEFREFLLDAVCLAGMGTIADVAPLRGENRVIAHYGLRGVGDSQAAGIQALCAASGVAQGGARLTGFDVAFKLGPRLNAAGRLGSARRCVELLTTASAERAREIAADLNRENARRQKLQEAILEEARGMVAAGGGAEGRRSIVLAREGWHAGVVGIVAARLAGEFRRPTVLLTLEGEEGHGSGRSIEPVNLFEALSACGERLCAFGGHAMAAGLRLKRGEVAAFTAEFEAAVAAQVGTDDLAPVLEIDAEVGLGEITRSLVDEFEELEPFGAGNREPVLADREAILSIFTNLIDNAIKYTPDGGHVDVIVQRNGMYMKVTVRDDGIGMTADERDRAFDEFFRAKNSYTVHVPGTGLGLSLAKRLVEMHHGKITVQTAPGQGSTFAVSIPTAAMTGGPEQ